MNFWKLFTLLGVVLMAGGSQVNASDIEKYKATPIEFQRSIAGINKINPLQNPRHEKSEKLLSRHVLDSKNKVVGEIEDIIIKPSGQVASIWVDFDRLRMGIPVPLDYEVLDLESTTTGYKLGFNTEEVEEIYPELLSNMETASGGDDEFYSLKKIIGTDLYTSKGIKIGKLQDVLFNQEGTRVRSVYLNIDYKMINNEGIAVPLYILSFAEKMGKMRTIIDQRYVDAVIQYADEDG